VIVDEEEEEEAEFAEPIDDSLRPAESVIDPEFIQPIDGAPPALPAVD